MARLASIEKAGYYPIPNQITGYIIAVLKAQHGGRVLDPTAGEGEAIDRLATDLLLEPYAAEIHTGRARETRARLDDLLADKELRSQLPFTDIGFNRVVGETFENISLAKNSIQLLYLNPPYDHGPNKKRLEHRFLLRSSWWLQEKGQLVFVVPQYILSTKEISSYLARWYEDILVTSFPEPYYSTFKQVVIFATKRKGQQAGEKYTAQRENLVRIGDATEDTPTGTTIIKYVEQNKAPREIPRPKIKSVSFKGLFVPVEIIAREHYKYGNIAQPEYEELFNEGKLEKKQPLMPFKIGHITRLIEAGIFDNAVLKHKVTGEQMMIKGRSRKMDLISNERTVDSNGTTRDIETRREVPVPDISVLYLKTGEVKVIKPEAITTLLEEWIEELTGAIQKEYTPLYEFKLGKYGPRIANRGNLYPAQKHTIAAVATRLETSDNAFIVGEQGVGKTRIGAAIILACKFRRVLFVVPPHLVKKWKREIFKVLTRREAEVVHIDRIRDVDEYFARPTSKKIQIGILKYTSARQASGWVPAVKITQIFTEEENEELKTWYALTLRARLNPALQHEVPILSEEMQAKTKKYIAWRTYQAKKGCQDSHMGKKLTDGQDKDISVATVLKPNGKQYFHFTKPKTHKLSKERQRYVPFYQFKRHKDTNYTYKQAAQRWETYQYGMEEMDFRSYKTRSAPPRIEPPKSKARWRIADYIKKHYKGEIDCVIFDEAHMAKAKSSDQGYALGRLSTAAKKTILMTGTIYGGYASTIFYLLYRTCGDIREEFTDKAAKGQRRIRETQWVDRYGMWEIRKSETTGGDISGANSGNRRISETRKEAPGSSPAMLPWLLERTAFLSLNDLHVSLPTYTEIPIAITATPAQMDGLALLETQLGSEMRQRLAYGDRGLLASYLQASICWPDSPWRDEIVIDPKTKLDPEPTVLAHIPKLPWGNYPKEKAIIEMTKDNVFNQDRKVLLLCQQTMIRDITPQWEAKLTAEGLKVSVLRARQVGTSRRERWIEQQHEKGVDVLITHPKAIEVGLDLLEFPLIIWMGTEYSAYTVQQASRRSYRIGQVQPVEVVFFYYEKTFQEIAAGLIAAKTAAAVTVNGDVIQDGSLADMDAGASIEKELGRMVANNEEAKSSLVNSMFLKAKQAEESSLGYIGNYNIAEVDEDEVNEEYYEKILQHVDEEQEEPAPVEVKKQEEPAFTVVKKDISDIYYGEHVQETAKSFIPDTPEVSPNGHDKPMPPTPEEKTPKLKFGMRPIKKRKRKAKVTKKQLSLFDL